jgi:hypothetical protein
VYAAQAFIIAVFYTLFLLRWLSVNQMNIYGCILHVCISIMGSCDCFSLLTTPGNRISVCGEDSNP